jgi:hypothetical protein
MALGTKFLLSLRTPTAHVLYALNDNCKLLNIPQECMLVCFKINGLLNYDVRDFSKHILYVHTHRKSVICFMCDIVDLPVATVTVNVRRALGCQQSYKQYAHRDLLNTSENSKLFSTYKSLSSSCFMTYCSLDAGVLSRSYCTCVCDGV